jgi:hypothetical protein
MQKPGTGMSDARFMRPETPQTGYDETLAKARGTRDGLSRGVPESQRKTSHAARSGVH